MRAVRLGDFVATSAIQHSFLSADLFASIYPHLKTVHNKVSTSEQGERAKVLRLALPFCCGRVCC